MSNLPIIWTPCGVCDRDTKHATLFSAEESEFDYRIDTSYQIVECCGCATKSFRKVISYVEDAYQINEDEWEVPNDIKNYPSTLKGHRSVPDIRHAPEIVGDIYRQSLDAIKNQSNILAGIGLRATIEAICNHQNVVGRSLDQRIDKLSRAGSISLHDADRLHAIRFMGNDAAHEIQPADARSLLIALRIVEHLIISLYILDSEANGFLQTLIKTYSEFEKLLSDKVTTATKGDEVPLSKLLGRDSRRFHGYLKSHETQLISNITSGNYPILSLGKYDIFAGSKEKYQHFVVV